VGQLPKSPFHVLHRNTSNSWFPVYACLGLIAPEAGRISERKNYQRVAFMAHSLGGIVTMRYLLHLKHRFDHDDLARVRLVLTFGTPFGGGSRAGLVRAFSNNPQVRVLVADNDFMQVLAGDFAYISGKRNDNPACPRLNFYSAYERKPVPPLTRLIVSRASATAFTNALGDVDKGFDVDHLRLVKPKNSTDDKIYKWTSGALRKSLDRDGLCEREIKPQCQ
jgi:pimeloyl-ACP methyl ester carboxylesterase